MSIESFDDELHPSEILQFDFPNNQMPITQSLTISIDSIPDPIIEPETIVLESMNHSSSSSRIISLTNEFNPSQKFIVICCFIWIFRICFGFSYFLSSIYKNY